MVQFLSIMLIMTIIQTMTGSICTEVIYPKDDNDKIPLKTPWAVFNNNTVSADTATTIAMVTNVYGGATTVQFNADSGSSLILRKDVSALSGTLNYVDPKRGGPPNSLPLFKMAHQSPGCDENGVYKDILQFRVVNGSIPALIHRTDNRYEPAVEVELNTAAIDMMQGFECTSISFDSQPNKEYTLKAPAVAMSQGNQAALDFSIQYVSMIDVSPANGGKGWFSGCGPLYRYVGAGVQGDAKCDPTTSKTLKIKVPGLNPRRDCIGLGIRGGSPGRVTVALTAGDSRGIGVQVTPNGGRLVTFAKNTVTGEMDSAAAIMDAPSDQDYHYFGAQVAEGAYSMSSCTDADWYENEDGSWSQYPNCAGSTTFGYQKNFTRGPDISNPDMGDDGNRQIYINPFWQDWDSQQLTDGYVTVSNSEPFSVIVHSNCNRVRRWNGCGPGELYSATRVDSDNYPKKRRMVEIGASGVVQDADNNIDNDKVKKTLNSILNN